MIQKRKLFVFVLCLCGATICASPSGNAQTTPTASPGMTPAMSPSGMSSSGMSSSTSSGNYEGFVLDSKIMGTHLKNQQKEDLGTISNLVINPETGHIRYAVVSTGGQKVVIPWSGISAESTTSGAAPNLMVNISKDKLSNAPKFDPNNLKDLYNRTTEEPIFTYYEMVWFPDVSSADEQNARAGGGGSSSSASSSSTDTTSMTPGTVASPTSTPVATASPH